MPAPLRNENLLEDESKGIHMSTSQEQASEQAPPSAKKPGLRELFHLSVVQAMETMDGLKPQKGTRSKINAALLGGVCVALLIVLITVHQLDSSLMVAIDALAVAIPPLAWGFLSSTERIDRTAPRWRMLAAIAFGAQVVETLGQIAVAVALGATLNHFSGLALQLYLLAILLTFVGVPVFAFISLFISALVASRKPTPSEPGKTSET